MEATVAVSAKAPMSVNPAYGIVSQCVMREPGWKTQFRIVISASVMPLVFRRIDFLVSTCPRKATKTVTKDNSIVLATSAATSVAVAGIRFPVDAMRWPQRG